MKKHVALLILIMIVVPVLLIGVDYIGLYHQPLVSCDVSPEIEHSSDKANAGCFVLYNNKLIMIKQSFTGKIALPGGSAQKGESAACTAHREVFEETGMDVVVQRPVYQFDNGFRLFWCVAKTLPNLHYSNLWETKHVIAVDPSQYHQQDYRFPEQRDTIIDLYRELIAQRYSL